jgi:hypothetical protein
MDNATAKEKLGEHKWKLYNTADLGLLPDGQIMRYIQGISHGDMDDLLVFMQQYVSVKNFDADSSIRYAYVTEPLIDNQTKAGNWRQVSVRLERVDSQGRVGPDGTIIRLVQTLAEGFLTSLPYADARLVETRTHSGDDATNGQERYVTLEWVGVDPDTLDTLSAAKSSTAVIDGLQYRKVQHDGATVIVSLGDGWHHLAVTGALAQDGSGTVRWLVADPEYVLEGFSSWLGSRQSADTYYFNVPEALAQGIIDTAKARGADAAPSGYNDTQGLVNIRVSQGDLTGVLLSGIDLGENCDEVVTGSFAWGVAGNTAVGVRMTGAGTAAANTDYKIAGLVDEKRWYVSDSSYSIRWSNANLRWELRSNTSSLLYVNTYNGEFPYSGGTWTAVSGSAPPPSHFAAAFEVLPIPATIPAGVSYDRNLSENGDGSFSVVLRTRTRKYRDISEYTSEHRADQTGARKEWKGVTDQDISADLAAQTGKVVRVAKAFREDCSVDINRDVITPVNQTATDAETRADRTSTTAKATQADAEASASRGVGEDNAIIRVSNVETEFGKHRTSREVIQPVAQTTTHTSESRADQTAQRVVEQNADAKKDATAVAGKVVRANSKENEFGRFDNSVETITPVDQSTTSGEDRADQSSTVTEHTQADAAVTAPPTAAAGTIARVQNRETEFGKFATREETLTAKAQSTTHASESRADRTGSRVVESNATAKADATGGGSGTIVNAQSRENEFGKFDNVTETLTSVNQTNTTQVDSDGRTVLATENTHAGVALVAPSASTGQRVTHRSRETEFGDFNTVVETSTGVKVDTGWVTFDHPDGTVGVRSIINGTSTDVTDVKSTLTTRATAGDATTLNVSPGEDGLYNVQATYRPQSFSARAESWGAQADETLTYGRYKDHNGTVWLAMKVYYYYNTTDGAAFTDLAKTTTGYTNVPSYRGVSSGARRVGVGRWVTVRVAVEIVTTTPVTVT